MTTDNKQNVQFHYMADFDQPLRVLTIATEKVDQDYFKVSYALNRVESHKTEHNYRNNGMKCKEIVNVLSYDPFNKSLARKIATGRLSCERHSLFVRLENKTDSVRKSVLTAVMNSVVAPSVVRKIAKQNLQQLNMIDKMNSEYNNLDYVIFNDGDSKADGRGID